MYQSIFFSAHKFHSQYGCLDCVAPKNTICSRRHHGQPRPGSPWGAGRAVPWPDQQGGLARLQSSSSWQHKRRFQQRPSRPCASPSGLWPRRQAAAAGRGAGRWGGRIHNVWGFCCRTRASRALALPSAFSSAEMPAEDVGPGAVSTSASGAPQPVPDAGLSPRRRALGACGRGRPRPTQAGGLQAAGGSWELGAGGRSRPGICRRAGNTAAWGGGGGRLGRWPLGPWAAVKPSRLPAPPLPSPSSSALLGRRAPPSRRLPRCVGTCEGCSE